MLLYRVRGSAAPRKPETIFINVDKIVLRKMRKFSKFRQDSLRFTYDLSRRPMGNVEWEIFKTKIKILLF